MANQLASLLRQTTAEVASQGSGTHAGERCALYLYSDPETITKNIHKRLVLALLNIRKRDNRRQCRTWTEDLKDWMDYTFEITVEDIEN